MAGRSEGDRLRKVFHRFQKPAVLEGRVAERLEVLRHDVAFSSLGSSAPAAKHARHPHEKGCSLARSRRKWSVKPWELGMKTLKSQPRTGHTREPGIFGMKTQVHIHAIRITPTVA